MIHGYPSVTARPPLHRHERIFSCNPQSKEYLELYVTLPNENIFSNMVLSLDGIEIAIEGAVGLYTEIYYTFEFGICNRIFRYSQMDTVKQKGAIPQLYQNLLSKF